MAATMHGDHPFTQQGSADSVMREPGRVMREPGRVMREPGRVRSRAVTGDGSATCNRCISRGHWWRTGDERASRTWDAPKLLSVPIGFWQNLCVSLSLEMQYRPGRAQRMRSLPGR